jgi:uncharacterized membrane protein
MLLTVLAAALTALYPLAVWLGHGRVEPRVMACLLLCSAVLRLPKLKLSSSARWLVLGALVLGALAMGANAVLPLKLYPVLVNVGFLATFAYSLAVPPSMVERMARLSEPDLPQEAVAYTRRVTQVWCVFFAANGAIALGTALYASEAAWSLYNGVVAYLLMGLLFGGEYIVRMRFKRRHHA